MALFSSVSMASKRFFLIPGKREQEKELLANSWVRI
jgi:hypothetical protein